MSIHFKEFFQMYDHFDPEEREGVTLVKAVKLWIMHNKLASDTSS